MRSSFRPTLTPPEEKKGFTTHQSKTPMHGFTLIELLVTISILAILSAIGLVIFSSVMKQGRDSKRQADLRSIQSALEQYNSDLGHYPFNTTSLEPKYMNIVPAGSPVYRYEGLPATDCTAADLGKCTSYCLYADMENSAIGVPAGCTYIGDEDFALTPP